MLYSSFHAKTATTPNYRVSPNKKIPTKHFFDETPCGAASHVLISHFTGKVNWFNLNIFFLRHPVTILSAYKGRSCVESAQIARMGWDGVERRRRRRRKRWKRMQKLNF